MIMFLARPAIAAPLPDLSVSLLDYNPDPAQPGQTIDFTIEIANSGNPTEDAWLEIVEDYPFRVLQTEDSERAKNLRVISGTQKLQFRIRIDEGAQDGITPLRIRYGASKASTVSQEASFDVLVETFGASIGIDKVEQNPARLRPGEEGIIKFTITNHDDQALNNVDLFLDLTDSYNTNANMDNTIAVQAMINARLEEVNRRVAAGLSPLNGATPMGVTQSGAPMPTDFRVLAPIEGSTLKRIGTIKPGETIIIPYRVQAMPDASPGIYAVPIYLNYNDEDNNPFHTTSEVPVLIDMESSPLVQIKASTLRTTDFAGDVTILVANKGLGELRYANIELVEDPNYQLITAPREAYVGTLGPGESAENTFKILPHEDTLELPVRVTYKDSFNQEIVYEETLELVIINKNYYRDMPYEMMLPWVVLGFVLLGLTWYFLRHLGKKK